MILTPAEETFIVEVASLQSGRTEVPRRSPICAVENSSRRSEIHVATRLFQETQEGIHHRGVLPGSHSGGLVLQQVEIRGAEIHYGDHSARQHYFGCAGYRNDQ